MPIGETIIKFGRYEGFKFKDIPVKYWQWLLDNNMCYKGVKHYIKDHLKLTKSNERHY
jgi:uncharacterized protein (DUF3820 family)